MQANPNEAPARNLQRPQATLGPAGFWIRVVASVIDSFVVGLVNWPVGFLIRLAFGVDLMVKPGDVGANFFVSQGVALVAGMAVVCAYYAYFYTQKGWSPGKKVVGLRVLNAADGTRLTIGQSIGREMAKFLSGVIFGIGFLMAAFRKDKRALHDLMAGSQVVHEAK